MSQFNVPIIVDDISALGIFAFQFKLNYNPAKIHPLGANFGCSTAGTLAGAAGLGATCNVTTAGILRVAVHGSTGMTGSGVILNLTFAPDPSVLEGDISPLDFTSVLFFNELGRVENAPTNSQVTFGPSLPTAAGAVVGGSVADAEGRPIPRVEVMITDNSTYLRRAISGPFGYFRFDDVPTGAVYVVNASSKRFTFQPRVVTVNDDIAGLDLIGVPN